MKRAMLMILAILFFGALLLMPILEAIHIAHLNQKVKHPTEQIDLSAAVQKSKSDETSERFFRFGE